jgi:alpha-N-arabinofuranosidase
MQTSSLAKLWLIVILAVPCLAHAQKASAPPAAKTIVTTIDATKVSAPISKYQYGMFIEHIGSLVYRTLWSEMLDDRKFYFPISSKPSAAAAHLPPRRFRRFMLRKWRPVGPDPSVVMDEDHPFVGQHSPRIELDPSAPHGIRQPGIPLVKGKRYIGHIYLRGTPGARVKVALIWGSAPADSQTVSFPSLSARYRKFPFHFTSKGDTVDGTFEITGVGSGNFHIGTVSLMPADNVEGFRPDSIALLHQLKSGFWRLPGGNFVSDFNWYDSVGNLDKRPPVFDHAWNAAQSNDVGLDEFMTLCRLIGVEPYITVNAGFGDAHSAAEEVEYMNGSVHTRFGAMRARNGHPAPYHLKFWNVGNEPYGPWELGRTDLKYYVLKHNEFARAMRKADPSIVILASGAMPDEMIIEGIARDMHLKNSQVGFCTDDDWTCGFLKHSWGLFDGITEHWYARAGVRFDPEAAEKGERIRGMEAGYVPVKQTVLQWVRQPSDRLHLKAEEWQEYERLFPSMIRKKIFMSNDEYAYTGAPTNLKLALAYAMVFNEMLRHTDFLRMSAFTMGVSTLDFGRTGAVLNTTGLLFKLYGDHMGAGLLPVSVSGNSPQPLPRQHLFGDLPRTNAGSPTYPLDVVAALSPNRKYLNLAVVNATESDQPLMLNVKGVRLSGKPTLWEMTGKDLNTSNRAGHKPQVDVKEIPMGEVPAKLSVPPISVDIYRFRVAKTAQ